jgi:hypothetical protein
MGLKAYFAIFHTIAREKSYLIFRYITFSDTTFGGTNTSRFFKIQTLLDILAEKININYIRGKELTLEKSMFL